MKKLMYLIAIMATVLTGCNSNSKKAASVETPVSGTDYVIFQGYNEKFGIKKNSEEIIAPTYDSLRYANGMFIGAFSFEDYGVKVSGTELIDPACKKAVLNSDNICYNSDKGYFYSTDFDGKKAIYFPHTQKTFAVMQDYALCGDTLLIKWHSQWGAYTTKNDTIVAPEDTYQKIALIKGTNRFLLQIDKTWYQLKTDKMQAVPVSSSELKKFKKMSGWKDDAEAFILQ